MKRLSLFCCPQLFGKGSLSFRRFYSRLLRFLLDFVVFVWDFHLCALVFVPCWCRGTDRGGLCLRLRFGFCVYFYLRVSRPLSRV